MKKFLLAVSFMMLFTVAFAQIKSPEAFLGYALGSRYTPHHKIVAYFNYIATAAGSSRMKLEQYGETNESRPLLLAYLSTAENMGKLDYIQQNNMRLTGLLADKPADANAPAIVWLSYNVHGNEPSSSEAALKTIYELVTANKAQEWLKNTVVIIDPCINPDGRDRYVNWFTQTVGKFANANPNAREHSEPWPGGRTNHYNFDLNRDWAWQTQVETQQRMKKYNAWMPHIHCDYHEQGYNDPYYFAPAAEPLHEVITQWQRDFQTTIGRNHAKYFDANGWLYFTRERFDLFYPAYGDTYPVYNGAIGMTYEQGGHSRGGLAVVKSDGDTLTLKDRIDHHFTTGMSTVEIASLNAATIVKEFKKFFDDANKGSIGEYKNYVITSDVDSRIKSLGRLLDADGIRYSYINKASGRGFNYFTGKDDAISLGKSSMLISSKQPRAAMVKVLFEPKSKLSDTATYDITAWSLPYAYGLQAYACKDEITTSNGKSSEPVSQFDAGAYGYIATYQSFKSAQLLAGLLQANIKVRYTEKDFLYKGKKFNKGSLIILKKGNEAAMTSLKQLLSNYEGDWQQVATGFMDNPVDFGGSSIHFIHRPKVALITGNDVGSNAAGGIWHFFEQQLNYPVTLINGNEAGRMIWKDFDVVILPDGNYDFIGEKNSADLKNWVRMGGKIIALEGAVAQMAGADWGIKAKKTDEDKKDDAASPYADVRRFENRERDWLVNSIPGAIYSVNMDDSHPLAYGYNNTYYTLKQDGNVYEFMKDGWNVGIIKKDNQVAGFAGSKVKEKLKDGMVIGVQEMGRGSIVYLAEDPLFRSFWENGKLLLSNAVFLVGQ
jgi:Zinc carboxypeptidase